MQIKRGHPYCNRWVSGPFPDFWIGQISSFSRLALVVGSECPTIASISSNSGARSVEKPILSLQLPPWLEEFVSNAKSSFTDAEDRMDFVIELSRLNIRHGGGPFAAGIFSIEDGSLLAAGINLVLLGRCSVLHGEIVAIMAAQQRIASHDLSSSVSKRYELATSTEPCAMCMGAITWSGIRRLICGARGDDAEATGFDEGEKPANWAESLERRGIEVWRDICREKAVAVLNNYRASSGVIYNPLRSLEHEPM
jgi:tRNA(Arg) A34 adenosine deaminase TadA